MHIDGSRAAPVEPSPRVRHGASRKLVGCGGPERESGGAVDAHSNNNSSSNDTVNAIDAIDNVIESKESQPRRQ